MSEDFQPAMGNPIIKRLLEAGVIPRHCVKFSIHMDVTDVIRIKSEVFVTEDQFREIADAIIGEPGAAEKLAREIIFRPLGDDTRTAKVSL